MKYNQYCFLFLLFAGIQLFAQETPPKSRNSFFITPEILLGKTMEANTGFPKTNFQKSFSLSVGNYSTGSRYQWAKQLNFPTTGFVFSITDFGNTEKVGKAYAIMPFVEFDILKNLSLNTGIGVSYIDTQFDRDTNPFNKAVTTKINWSFRSFFYYNIKNNKAVDWRLGLGYTHFSNGHTRLPNQGLNSFLISISSRIGKDNTEANLKNNKEKVSEKYVSFRTGIGQNVLSRVFNDKKEVYSIAFSVGNIINRTFKYGVGMHYRFYEHYYDHIKENKRLVEEQVPHYRKNPYRYATNFGFFGTAELLIGHFGAELDIGINIYKPFYKIDWQLSQGYFHKEDYTKLGELDWYYKVKKTVSSRLGVKYYLINTAKSPKNNLFFGANLNANLGQADFSEFNIGYVYRFGLKNRK